jgi:hypothetical protein
MAMFKVQKMGSVGAKFGVAYFSLSQTQKHCYVISMLADMVTNTGL